MSTITTKDGTQIYYKDGWGKSSCFPLIKRGWYDTIKTYSIRRAKERIMIAIDYDMIEDGHAWRYS